MRKKSFLTIMALGIAVSACGGTKNKGVESVHQPVVSRTDYVFDVGASSGGLAAGDAQRLAGWFDSLRLGYGDKVAFDAPDGYGASGAREAVAAIAARYGLLLQDGAPVTTGDILPGTGRVIVSRTKATVPGCPDWSRTNERSFGGHSNSNYGCAVNSNLAAMVADPEDLVLGSIDRSPSDAAVAGKAIKVYRDAEPTGVKGLKAESVKSGGQ